MQIINVMIECFVICCVLIQFVLNPHNNFFPVCVQYVGVSCGFNHLEGFCICSFNVGEGIRVGLRGERIADFITVTKVLL